jgi:SSS family solute:Na+ symporter
MASGTQIQINALDLFVIAVYLVGIVALGCWAGMRHRRGMASGRGYFLAGQSLTWPMIGLALFSTNISTAHLVGMAQQGYMNGMVYGNLEWLAVPLLIVLALFFAPFYIRTQVATLPDFLEKRYDRRSRDWLAVVGILSAVLLHTGMALYSGAVLFSNLFDVPVKLSVPAVALLTVFYTVIGGLVAVVTTESVQAIIMLAGSALLVIFGLVKVGGWSEMVGHVEPQMMSILRDSNDPSGMPWYAATLGYPVLGLWYWCADQTIVQRVLGAKDEHHARMGPLFCGFLKILPVFLFTLPGIILYAMIKKGQCPALAHSEDAYGFLVRTLMPPGVRGLMVAAMLAAMMSTVSGAINSAAVLFTYDVYKRFKPQVDEARLVNIGRWATVFAMLLGVMWTPIVDQFKSIIDYALAVVCHISPPITAVFLWGVLWHRATPQAGAMTLRLGSGLCFVAFLLTSIPGHIVLHISPFMDCFYLFLLCSGLLFVVSLWRPQTLSVEQAALVWDSPWDAVRQKGWPGLADYRFVAGVLVSVMVVLYIYFR